jgi:vacuolar-type H+-ATPase subunit H
MKSGMEWCSCSSLLTRRFTQPLHASNLLVGEAELNHVVPHSKQDLLSEVRMEAHHVAETLSPTATVGKQDLLSEVRKEAHHVAEGLKPTATVDKQELLSEVRSEGHHVTEIKPAATVVESSS